MRTVLIFVTVIVLSPIGFSADIYVPDDYGTIQAAIDNSLDGDTVIVRPGTYVENIDFLGKAITVRSELGPELTTVDGGGVEPVAVFDTMEPESAVLAGFTITNGVGMLSDGGGIRCTGSSPSILDNIIIDNHAGCDGAGIRIDSGKPVIAGNKINDNVTIFYKGGGIACLNGAAPLISDNLISGNVSNHGGGIYCAPGSAPEIRRCAVVQNSAQFYGGGIHCDADSLPILSENRICENFSFAGGGISCEGCRPALSRNEISGNYTSELGGGVYFLKVDLARGFSGNTISDNQAFMGGGLALDSCTAAEFVNCIVSGNELLYTTSMAAGIFCMNDADLSLINCTVTDNIGSTYGGGVYCGNKCSLVVRNTVLWGNEATIGAQIDMNAGTEPTTCDISYSDVEGGQNGIWLSNSVLTWGDGMIEADPLFIDPSNNDFHIPFDSPCRSAGDRNAPGLPDTDFEGDPRTGLFAFPDIGADEFHVHFYVNGIVSNGGIATGVIIGWPKTNPVMLISGSGVLPTPDPTPYGDFWLIPPWDHRVHFNPMPDNGVRKIDRVVSTALPPGTQIPFQALVGTELSNLMVLTVE